LTGIRGRDDYDTFAADLKTLLDTLDRRDMVWAGFSMGKVRSPATSARTARLE
jgi:hypothetical protein